MKTFKVKFKEIIFHEFYVDADTEEDVFDEFYNMADKGELDFSDGEVVDSEIMNIKEV